ncbi:MAG: hypothetical protein NVSMB19_21940 [Vulcanimicrobiaceae bacterium]
MNDFDDLDRALFALPLATPPPELREAILRATIDASQATASPAPFTRGDIVGIGLALAVAAWLIVAASVDHRFAAAIAEGANGLVGALTDPTTLAWTTTGGAIAALLTLANFPSPRRGIWKR